MLPLLQSDKAACLHRPAWVFATDLNDSSPLVKSIKKYFSYFLIKTYVVGTQKNRLNETVLLSTENFC